MNTLKEERRDEELKYRNETWSVGGVVVLKTDNQKPRVKTKEK